MTRPLFLQRITTRPPRCINREPVRFMTERDYEIAALMLGFTAGAGAMALAMLVIITFYWRPTCF